MSYNLQTLRGDVFGGITATIVALPVALAFGVASSLGAAAGFFAAVFGGTRCQISGPTGPMTVSLWRSLSPAPPTRSPRPLSW